MQVAIEITFLCVAQHNFNLQGQNNLQILKIHT